LRAELLSARNGFAVKARRQGQVRGVVLAAGQS
jgi:hypothetical protein